jgi:hypothetical protein
VDVNAQAHADRNDVNARSDWHLVEGLSTLLCPLTVADS